MVEDKLTFQGVVHGRGLRNTRRFVDREAGVVCYVVYSPEGPSIACLPVSVTRL